MASSLLLPMREGRVGGEPTREQSTAVLDKKDRDEAGSTTTGDDTEKADSSSYPRAHLFVGNTMSVLQEIAFFAVVSTANFLPISGFHQALCILHIIGDDLGIGNEGQLSWLMAGYGLTVGTLILFAGRLGDVYGHKPVFLLGNVWLGLASFLAGASAYLPAAINDETTTTRRYAVLLTARLLQGIGPALCIPNGVALLGVTYAPGPRKDTIFAIFGAMAPASAVISPLFASLMAEFASGGWPWAFWALGAVSLLVAFAGHFAIPNASHRNNSASAFKRSDQQNEPNNASKKSAKLVAIISLAAELDLFGAVTGILGLALISAACNQGAFVGWNTPYVPTLLAAGILLCVAFTFIERRQRNSTDNTSRQSSLSTNDSNISNSRDRRNSYRPLVPFEALSTDVACVLAAVFCGWACFGIWIYYIWSFYTVIRGATPLLACAWHSPILVSGCVAAIFAPRLLRRGAPGVMALALAAFTAGAVLAATAPADQTYWLQTFLGNVIVTWGMDLSFPAATLLLSDLVGQEHQGVAASFVTTVVNYAGALALGIAGSVEAWARERSRRSRTGNGGDTIDGGYPSGQVRRDDLLSGYRAAWWLAVGFGALGFLVSLSFVPRWRRKKQEELQELQMQQHVESSSSSESLPGPLSTSTAIS